jgi:hypothetical protein
MKLKPVFWPVIAVVLLILYGLLILELKPRTVTVSMLWECGLPEHFDVSEFVRKNPAAKPVTLRFARYPNIVNIDAQPGLCDALKAAGKRVVPAVVLPIGEPFGKITGYDIQSVNGYDVRGPYYLENGNLGGYAPALEELLR